MSLDNSNLYGGSAINKIQKGSATFSSSGSNSSGTIMINDVVPEKTVIITSCSNARASDGTGGMAITARAELTDSQTISFYGGSGFTNYSTGNGILYWQAVEYK